MRLAVIIACAMLAACVSTERDRMVARIEAQADAVAEAAESCGVRSDMELIDGADPTMPSSYRCRPIESPEGL
ncbi:hypothetical protein DFR49_2834 [Hephaestia caeni]|uniref:Lipoprotein n=1 Tax=Hephaestia caeni TaxID=645617 RepID=A0A397PBU4_9SPHN|nr:hypothetical protein [Hephaestia caeni]RIA44587.1 hypothetical protein DFR49_2834 [Hephaestia caeni]